jgi:hypothetical protein
VTINVADTGTGTASAADFSLNTTSVTFAAGSTDGAEQTVNLTLTDDGVLESPETVILQLTIGIDGTGGRASIGGTGSHTVAIIDDPMTGSISGFVWADTNVNGGRDADELLIPGVTVRLTGTDNLGNPVGRTTTTNADGAYSFTNLPIGSYQMTEDHPAAFNDGSESLGTVGGSPSGQAGNDRFTLIALGPAAQGTNYNFGEWGLAAQYVNARFFLARMTAPDLVLRGIIQPSVLATSAQQAVPAALALAAQAVALQATAVDSSHQAITAPAPSAVVQPAAAAVVPAFSSVVSAAAADASMADFAPPTFTPEPAIDAPHALALAAAIEADHDSAPSPTAAGAFANSVLGQTESGPEPVFPMLLDDQAEPLVTAVDGAGHDEQLTDLALDDEESWLEELLV